MGGFTVWFTFCDFCDNQSQVGETTVKYNSHFRLSNSMPRSEIPPCNTYLVSAFGDLAISTTEIQVTTECVNCYEKVSIHYIRNHINVC